jgi:hypothetical protein
MFSYPGWTTDRDILAYYPYVVVRLVCDRCTRTGAFRLARLTAKFGPNISLDHLIAKLVATECPYWKVRHPYHGTCRARLIDLYGFREVPDLPPAIFKSPDVARMAAALAQRAREAGLPESAQALEMAAFGVKSYLDVGSERAGGAAITRSSTEHGTEKKQV